MVHPDDKGFKYEVPFLPNLKGETAIHNCIIKQDFKAIDTILKYLGRYPIDHHSRSIKDINWVFIREKLPEYLNYLDSRLLPNQ